MLVRDFMTRGLVMAQETDPVGPTLQRMREEGLRRMPVLNQKGQLVGIISDRRLLQALAVPVRRGEFRHRATVSPNLTVGAVMNREILTTAADTPLETAAADMARRRVGSLIVVEGESPVGIITETDMFRVFLRLLVGEEHGLRVAVRAPAFRGILADIATGVARAGGNLLSLGSLTDDDGFSIAFKVADLNQQDLEDILSELPVQIIDIREM